MKNPFTYIKDKISNYRREKRNAELAQKERGPSADERAKTTLNKAGFAYYQYIWRLNEKKATSMQQKRQLLKRFLETHVQDLDHVRGLVDRPDEEHGGLRERIEEYVRVYGIKHPKMAVAMMLDFCAMADENRIQTEETQGGVPQLKDTGEGVQTDLFEKNNYSFGPATEEEKQFRDEVQNENSFFHSGVSEKQKQGIRDCTAWLYRNSQKKNVFSRIPYMQTMGHRNRLPFVDEIAKLSDREKLLIFFLVEKGREEFCTKVDVYVSQEHVPDPAKFKSQMQSSKAKFWLWLGTGGYVKWELLSAAILKCRQSYSLFKEYENDIRKNQNQKAEQDRGKNVNEINNNILNDVNEEGKKEEALEDVGINDILNEKNDEGDNKDENPQIEGEMKENDVQPENEGANNVHIELNLGQGDQEAETAKNLFLNGFMKFRELNKMMHDPHAKQEELEAVIKYFNERNNSYINDVDAYVKGMLLKSEHGHSRNFFKWDWKRHRQLRVFRKNLAKMRKQCRFDGPLDPSNKADILAFAEKSLNLMKHASDFNSMIYDSSDLKAADKVESDFQKVDKFLNIWTFTGGVLGPALSNAGFIYETAASILSKPVETASDSVTPWANAGTTQAEVKDPFAWCETAGTVNTALGIAKGAVKFSSGVYHLDHARKSEKALENAKQKLEDSTHHDGENEGEKRSNAGFVSDIINLKHQKNRSEKHQGGMNVAYGTLGMISGILTLSGVGAPIAKACDLISYALMGIDFVFGKIIDRNKKIGLIDRYLGIDDTMLQNEGRQKVDKLHMGYHNELRHMLEAKCGAHNDQAMLNIIAWKYGNFLHSLCFVRKRPAGDVKWITQADKDNLQEGEQDGDLDVRKGASIMLENMFGKNIYSRDGKEPPKITVNMIRAKFQF